ncbi:RNA polymerase sigma factor [Paenibacillus flagellatus]|uniref:RNA polymerase subunit sigma-70 n=1 Tax=Paenibacillus flagellatus TaxID=2211139 RepID=A0A2V5K5X8_9BACL|nr:sigma-70 family RNA polymerase sigma factor [Paenibacillus flagellatus]PYI53183.1 RNA polymerase subunit sigma-70 [Paenibacillus flagellatus]
MESFALDRLMRDFGKDVWNYAYFLTRDRHASDDISQEVFLRAFRSVKDFRGESSVKTWLLKITRNLSYNYRNSAFLRRVALLGWVRRRETVTSAENEFMDQAAANAIWRIILDMPLPFREVLLLDIQHEMTTKEMAGVLGVAEGTVKSRLHRARAKVSNKLREVGAHE